MRNSYQTNNNRIVADVHDGDVHPPHVEPVLGQVVEAVSLTQADEYLCPGKSHALDFTQLGIKLSLELVNNFWHANITEEGIVLCTKHHCVGLN